ncbi:MAG: hypothetical protein ACI3WR_00265 [Oscillospiraceae bacterium]
MDPHSPASSRRPTPLRRCSFCGAPLFAGDESWQLNGLVVCRACFPDFAERELAPYFSLCGEGDDVF